MKSFTVHERPNPRSDLLDRAEELVFVKDGFNLFAAILAPVWMLMNRMWLVFVLYLIVLAALEVAFHLAGAGAQAQSAVAIGLNLLIGFEADSLRRWSLERRGWNLIGTVTGENADVCERRFFEKWVPGVPVVDSQTFTPHGPQRHDPYAAATAPQKPSNLGPVIEPKPRGWFGGWRSGKTAKA